MKTIIYYYSATGNSLYVARFLQERLPETELRSIPEELAGDRLSVQADTIGFVFPMHYLSLPLQVEEFLEKGMLRFQIFCQEEAGHKCL
jgi:flavodoxin